MLEVPKERQADGLMCSEVFMVFGTLGGDNFGMGTPPKTNGWRAPK